MLEKHGISHENDEHCKTFICLDLIQNVRISCIEYYPQSQLGCYFHIYICTLCASWRVWVCLQLQGNLHLQILFRKDNKKRTFYHWYWYRKPNNILLFRKIVFRTFHDTSISKSGFCYKSCDSCFIMRALALLSYGGNFDQPAREVSLWIIQDFSYTLRNCWYASARFQTAEA